MASTRSLCTARPSQCHVLPSIQSALTTEDATETPDVQGAIVDVNLNSFNYGLVQARGRAGSPPQPGVVARFHLADALFLPKAAEKTFWAQGMPLLPY